MEPRTHGVVAIAHVLKTKYGMEKKPKSRYIDDWKVEPIAPYGDLDPKTPGDPMKKHRTKVCPQAAVAEMRAYVENATNLDPWPESDHSKEHLTDCLDKIESGEVEGAKAHRWLGWVQGVLGARGNGSVKEFGGVNKRSKR